MRGRGEILGVLSSLGLQLKARLLQEAVESARRGRHLVATARFDQSGVQPGEQSEHADNLAYAFYRRALSYQSDQDESRATGDLEKARQFPGVPVQLRSLIQQRLTAIQKGPHPEIRKFDKAIAGRFDRPPSVVELRGEFLNRYGLSQANRLRTADGIDQISSVGVYRWAGDRNRNEQWSRLIRQFKGGDPVLPAFFGRILSEHMRATATCKAWLGEVDFVVPVPAAACRTAERGINILERTSEHLCWRLGIPIRTDFLRRKEGSERSRFVRTTELASQYRFNKKNAEDIRGRTVMLLDDVMNRGHTTGVCASLLSEFGCTRVFLLVLAQAESSLQSSRHARQQDC